MQNTILLALLTKIVEEKFAELPSAARGPRGFRGQRGEPGEGFVFAENEEKIRAWAKEFALKFEDFTDEQIEALRGPRGRDGKDGARGESFDVEENEELLRAFAQEFAIKFDDLTVEQVESLRGPRGRDGKDGRPGDNFEFEQHQEKITAIIQETVESLREKLALRFSDLDESEVEQLRGPRGRDGRDGRNFNFEEHREFFEGLKPKFADFSPEEVDKLRLHFNQLTEDEKNSLKLRFEDLTDEDRLRIRGPRGQRGAKGRTGDPGQDGRDGKDGRGIRGLPGHAGRPGNDGRDGRDGRDGLDAPWVTSISVNQTKDEFSLVFHYSDGSSIESEEIDLPKVIKESWVIGGGIGNSGKNGKSAYDIAVDNGFVGTEQEWLDSLKGEDGAEGPEGPPGPGGGGGGGSAESEATLENDQATPVAVPGFIIGGSRSYYVHYCVERTRDSNILADWETLDDVDALSGFTTTRQTGMALVTRQGDTVIWTDVFKDTESGVNFTINDLGQVLYTASDLPGGHEVFKVNWSYVSRLGTGSLEAPLNNNQTTPEAIVGMVPNPVSNMVHYYIERVTTLEEHYESGILLLTKTTNNWRLSYIAQDGDAGVILTPTATGQVEYTSTDVTGVTAKSRILWGYLNLTGTV